MPTARSVTILLMLAILALFMAACASQRPKEQSAARAAPEAAMQEGAAPTAPESESYSYSIQSAMPAVKSIPRKKKSRRPASIASIGSEQHEPLKMSTGSVMAASAGAAPTPDADTDPAIQVQRIDTYLSNLKSAAYTFNPPSPIKVDEPKTIYLWLDPQATTAELAEELRKSIPQQDAGRIESGKTKWSPIMRATLSAAPDDFTINAIDSEEQPVSSTQRTTWSWNITPRRPGKNLQLHLRLAAVLPASVGPPKTITTLDRNITVEVTKWWLFDHYYEKYWKALLGGLGGILVSIGGWWWKNKHAAAKKPG